MNYTQVTNPRWANAQHTLISCSVFFTSLNETVPFTASPSDPEAHSRDIFAKVSNGNYGSVAAYIPPVEPPTPVPQSISDRQFFQQLAIMGKIAEAEALAAVMTGVLPAILQAFVDSLPEFQQFSAKMILSGGTEFLRDHPMTAVIGQSQDMSETDVDAFFVAARSL